MHENSHSRPGGTLSAIVATVGGNLYLIVATVVFSTVALLLCWLPPRGRWVFRVARVWSRGLLLASGVRLTTAFETELDPEASYIYMANHQSLFDIPALIAGAPGETRFMAKRSLFQIPLFGWALKAGGFVSIDRKNQGRARAGFSSAMRELRSGASVVVFPEGTRSLDGRLLPLKRGGLLLAIRSGLPIVPVGVRGTLGIRSRASYAIRPGTAELHYGAPIPCSGVGVRELRQLEATLADRLSELAGVPRSSAPSE
jgi:1-acyl-sn-glycerol-3-phosphate acyltransferase